jgi:archaemetzincin
VIPAIRVLNSSSIHEQSLGHLAGLLREAFAAAVSIERVSLDLTPSYDASRRQSNSTILLAQILERGASPAKKIAVVDVDLFIPVLTYVFGEAQLNGTAAVVSTHRLQNQFYGLPQRGDLLIERLEKEVIHELGHTFGLYHCHQFECVMRSSTYVEEIDMKRNRLCPGCISVLKNPGIVSGY